MQHNEGDTLVFKASLIARLLLAVVAIPGLLLMLGAWVAAVEEGPTTSIVMALAGLVFVAVSVVGVLGWVKVTGAGVTYWYLVKRHIPASQISALRVGEGSGAYYPRLAIWIDRVDGEAVRLTLLQRADTQDGKRALNEIAGQISAVVQRH